jgi:DNA-binding NarL/FixJ family response regulator
MEQQSKLLTEANRTLAEMHEKLSVLQEKDQKSSDFNRSLNQAEISVRLQKSRLSAQNYNRSMSPPERYSYVHSLAAKGMSSQEIALVLSISIHEADQLVNLSRLAHSE